MATKHVPRDLTISSGYKVSHARRRTRSKVIDVGMNQGHFANFVIIKSISMYILECRFVYNAS